MLSFNRTTLLNINIEENFNKIKKIQEEKNDRPKHEIDEKIIGIVTNQIQLFKEKSDQISFKEKAELEERCFNVIDTLGSDERKVSVKERHLSLN